MYFGSGVFIVQTLNTSNALFNKKIVMFMIEWMNEN